MKGFPHWHNFLSIGETFVMSNLLKTTMNKVHYIKHKIVKLFVRSLLNDYRRGKLEVINGLFFTLFAGSAE